MPSALTSPIYNDVRYYYGDPQVPRDVRNLRASTQDALRQVGTPVLLKRMFTVDDIDNNDAVESPSWDTIYKQVRNDDPLSYGVGYVSPETQQGEWYDTQTFEIFVTSLYGPAPQPTYTGQEFALAPRYRGYGPGFLTYVLLPDRPEDVFKLTPQGSLVRTQSAKLQLPWWPLVGDNDLLITVALDDAGRILDTYERYQLKMVTPITMRGLDNSGRREITNADASGNRFWVGQECEAIRLPKTDITYQVEVDR